MCSSITAPGEGFAPLLLLLLTNFIFFILPLIFLFHVGGGENAKYCITKAHTQHS